MSDIDAQKVKQIDAGGLNNQEFEALENHLRSGADRLETSGLLAAAIKRQSEVS